MAGKRVQIAMAGKRVQIVWEEADSPESLREGYRRQGEGEGFCCKKWRDVGEGLMALGISRC